MARIGPMIGFELTPYEANILLGRQDRRAIVSGSSLDADRYMAVWRMAAYAAESCLLDMQIKLMSLYNLPPLDLVIFNLIAVASVQRSARLNPMSETCDDIAPRDVDDGTISRRRVAEATGVARTSVARAIDRLGLRGLVVESGRGQLRVPLGIILQRFYASDPRELYAPILTPFDRLQRLGVIDAIPKERKS